jgi:NAD(P)H dehydrogenase (quinone)
MADIGIVYYSMYGTAFELAQKLAEGIDKAGGTAQLRKVPDLLPEAVRESAGVAQAIEAQAGVADADVDELAGFDGLLFGSGTRFGKMTGQLSNFLDQTGALWANGSLVGKPAGFFTGASTMHGGHESTILGMSTYAHHQGMVIVPAGYAIAGNQTTRSGGTPYGPSYFAPQDGSKQGLSDDEIQIALDYGAHFHTIAAKLAA